MTAQNDKQIDKRISLLLSAVDSRTKEPDKQFLEKLRERSTAEFIAYPTDSNQQSEKTIPISKWRIIMKSPITKLAAAAIIVVAVLVCTNYFGGKVDLTTIAFAEISEAMRNVPWMHVKAKIDAPQRKGQIEEWICFEKSIEITKRVNGSISYRDEGQDTMYVYDPVSNIVTIISMSDRYAVPRRTPMPDSPSGAIDALIETMKEEGRAQLSVSYDEIDGQPVKILHAVSTIQGESVVNQDVTIIINAESMLPITMDSVATIESGDQSGIVHIDFDYPSEGPKDIYSLGIPHDAEVIDRRPKPGIESEINYKYVMNPENPVQEMLMLYGGINIDLVKIPEGQFLMGSPEDEIGYPAILLERYQKSKQERVRQMKHRSSEDPQHLVKINRGFYISKYEITCAQFRKLHPEFRKYPHSVGALTGRKTTITMDLDEQPACMSLDDALEFCKWLGEKTDLSVRLASEAEWEYACRAGTQTRFYWGDSEEEAGKYANLADKSYEDASPGNIYTLNTDDGNIGLAPVGQYIPNNFGLYDMIGNAPEWVRGIYSVNAYSIDPDNKFFVESNEDNQQQYCRGGSWRGDIIDSRCASRGIISQDSISNTVQSYIGFRILIDEP
jgi:formylglycine-generating enzyme required for sulfatase activity